MESPLKHLIKFNKRVGIKDFSNYNEFDNVDFVNESVFNWIVDTSEIL